MGGIEHLVEDWRSMKARLEHQLEHLENAEVDQQHHTVKETVQRWIVELDDLIIKYSFEI